MKTSFSPYAIALFLLISMHIAGVIGLNNTYTQTLFEQLVAFNLITTAIIVFYFHTDFQLPFLLFCIITALTGYIVEVIGVHTGQIFGNYIYGNGLGFKILEVPLLIGINWLVLIYCTGVLIQQLVPIVWIRPFIGAVFLVILDFFIEPFAIRHDLWAWKNNSIPFKNYLAWFILSVLLLQGFQWIPFRKKNKIAVMIYGIQLLFFISNYFFRKVLP
jgi:putative membrane protein